MHVGPYHRKPHHDCNAEDQPGRGGPSNDQPGLESTHGFGQNLRRETLRATQNTVLLVRKGDSNPMALLRCTCDHLRITGSERYPMPPRVGNGKICYVEFPATDIQRCSEFY